MPSNIFDSLLTEQAGIFKNAFSNISSQLFFDKKKEKLFHAGEYGNYRESVSRNFLSLVTKKNLSVDQGFLINAFDEVSSQCDIIIYDNIFTPNIQTKDRLRFFPVETVAAVGEVKSTLSKVQFKEALNKLSRIKLLREKIKDPYILRGERHNQEKNNLFTPREYSYDQLFSFLICEKLDFDISNLPDEINSLYDPDTHYSLKHNLILSVSDGMLCYHFNFDHLFPGFENTVFKNRFIKSNDSNNFIKTFASNIYLGTSKTTILSPEFSNYINVATEDYQKHDEK